MKKLLCALLALCLLLPLLPVTASAASTVDSGYCGMNVTWTLTSDGTLTISGKGEMNDFYLSAGATPWYSYNGDIKKIVVKSGITDIGEGAFYDCDATSAVLADTVTEIEDGAFRGCRYLTSITLPDSLRELGDGVFSKSGLESITLPAGITEISERLFADSALKSFTCLGRIREVDEQAFYDCDNLTKVAFTAASGCEIGTEAFAYCDQLTTVQLSGSVETVEGYAFAGCKKLSKVTLPEGLKYLGEDSFYDCDGLTGIVLPSTVTYADYAFTFCDSLKSMTVPAAVLKNSDGYLFWGCDSLAYVHVTGNAPRMDADVLDTLFARVAEGFTIYYDPGTTGWTEPTWNGIPCAEWDPMAAASITVTASNDARTGKIKLSWNAVEGAVEYKVYRATSKNGTYSLMYTAKGTSYTNSKAEPGRYYYYKVVAVAGDGSASAPSAIVGRTCDLARPVVTASNVAKSGKVKLTWDAVEGAVEYKVYRATSKNGTYKLMKTLTGTGYTNTNAEAGKTYYYKVKAIAAKSAANSANSEIKSRTCDLARPTASVTRNSSGDPVISWGKVSGAAKYKLYIYNADGDLIKTSTVSGTKITHGSATAGRTYSYRVQAVCSVSAAASAKSPAVSIKAK